MRSTSQIFADFLRANEHAQARKTLKKEGYRATSALKWLSIYGQIDDLWINQLKTDVRPSEEEAQQAFLLALAPKTPWSVREKYCLWLLEHIEDAQFYTEKNAVHHAAYHGCFEVFDTLQAHHKKITGSDIDWNHVNNDAHTPLSLALSQIQLECVVNILRQGGLGTFLLTNPKNPQEKMSAMQRAFNTYRGPVDEIQNTWKSAQEKASLGEALQQVLTKKKKQNKKI